MSTDEEGFLYKELTYKLIGLAMEVHKNLGDGFLEKVYENAMMVTLKRVGIASMQQAPITVHFEGEVVGEYYADILVEEKIRLCHC